MVKKPVQIRIADNSGEIKALLEKATRQALEDIGARAVDHASQLTPVDTGLLRNSLTYALDGESPAIKAYSADKGDGSGSYSGRAPERRYNTVFIGTNVEYAPAIEEGGRNRKGFHMLRKAITENQDEYKEILQEHLKKAQK